MSSKIPVHPHIPVVAFNAHTHFVFDLIVYEQDQGQRPYDKWFDSLRDKRMQSRIIARLDQVRAGDLGDCKSVGEGVIELRIDAGPGTVSLRSVRSDSGCIALRW